MFAFTCVAFLLLILAKMFLVVVPRKQEMVVERLGDFRAVLKPGLHVVVPILDNIVRQHEIREEIIDVPPQLCITKDNIEIKLDGAVYIQVMDPKNAHYEVGDYRHACIERAQATMRSEIGKVTLGQSFSKRKEINDAIVTSIDESSMDWGVKVRRYEIKDIKPSNSVISTLEQQMEAERKKAADITRFEAQKTSQVNISEGERQSRINLSEGKQIAMTNVSQGKAEEIAIVTTATAEGMELVGAALSEAGGEDAVQVQLMEKFIEKTGELIGYSKVTIMPGNMTQISALFEGIDRIKKPLTGAK